ncbi:hypothetical protein BV25DRAFT_1918216 [Artomyces pyxidatus]|nr:hypothetical protein BV25DRAFT_1918216 [Artomyces pyxidatus]
MGVALLVPEWVLAWAVRQLLGARDLAKELEAAGEEAVRAWDEKRAKLAGWDESATTESDEMAWAQAEDSTIDE